MGDASNNGDATITLYTSYRCPWAHRAQIVLRELGLDYEEKFVDLDNSRTEEYLKLNPRGLVPTITMFHPSFSKPQTMIESAPIVYFILDAYPHLSQQQWPAPINLEAAHVRYRMSIFVETFFTKVQQPHYFKLMFAIGTDHIDERVDALISALRDHVEPLLEDAKPFFGGSSTMTVAEILTAPFVLRFYHFATGEFFPKSLQEKMDDLPNFSSWAHATISKDSVICKWDKDVQVQSAVKLLPKFREKYGSTVK